MAKGKKKVRTNSADEPADSKQTSAEIAGDEPEECEPPGAKIEPIDDCRSKEAELGREVESFKDKWLRAEAELQNFKKRAVRDRQREVVAARSGAIIPLLDVLDDLERALGQDGESEESLQQGISLIYQKFIAALAAIGVRSFDSMGSPFDPEKMDALASVPVEGVAAGEVVGEIRKGYTMGDRMLRHAQVSVAAESDGSGKKKESTSS